MPIAPTELGVRRALIITRTDTATVTRVAGVPHQVRHARAAMIAGLPAVFVAPDRAAAVSDGPTVVIPEDVTYHRLLLTRLAEADVLPDEIVRIGDARASIHLVGPAAAQRFHAARGDDAPPHDRELALATGEFVVRAGDDDARDYATELHLLSLRKRTAGFLDRTFLRDLSRPITRLLLDTPVSPNAVTLAAFGVVLGAAACVLVGTSAAHVAAFVLLMLARVVDCVDGELARIRFETSRFGEWLDGTLDNVGVGVVLGSIAYHVQRTDEAFAPVAWISLGSWILSSLVMMAALAKVDSGAFQAIGWEHRRRQDTLWARVLRRAEALFQIDAVTLFLGLGLLTSSHRTLTTTFALAGLGVSIYGAVQIATGKVGARAEAVRR